MFFSIVYNIPLWPAPYSQWPYLGLHAGAIAKVGVWPYLSVLDTSHNSVLVHALPFGEQTLSLGDHLLSATKEKIWQGG